MNNKQYNQLREIWHQITGSHNKLYFRLLTEAKDANYEFNLYLGSKKATFLADKVTILDDSVLFSGSGGILKFGYGEIKELYPNFKCQTIAVVGRKPAPSSFVLALLMPCILGAFVVLAASPVARIKVVKDVVAPDLMMLSIDSLVVDYIDPGPYRQWKDKLAEVALPIIAESFIRGFGAAILGLGALTLLLFVFVLRKYNNERMVATTEGNAYSPTPPPVQPHQKITQDSATKRPELAINLIKALSWPIFWLFILYSFWDPIQAAAKQIPDILRRSEAITIATLSIKIGQSLQAQGLEPTDQIKEVLTEMTINDVKQLLHTSPGGNYFIGDSGKDGKSDYAGLVKLGLVSEVSSDELIKEGPDHTYGIKITELGIETQKLLYAVTDQFLKQLAQPSTAPNP